MRVSASSEDSEEWINRGVVHMLGFNPEEAIRCFHKALSFSPDCAMAHLFIAHCYAPNHNDPTGLDWEKAKEAAQLALSMVTSGGCDGDEGWERGVIEAQMLRYAAGKSQAERRRSYCDAMRDVYEKFGGENLLVATLFAESLMMLAPWHLWTRPPNVKPAIPETEELVEVLERGLEQDPTHPGLCHFYIHTMELSATPEKALPAADALRTRVPDQGHLLHMPGHIDMWVGNFKEAVDTNKLAVAADEKYVRVTGQDNEMYKLYRVHNYHFTVWAAMFDGQFSTAMEYAEGLRGQITPEALQFTQAGTPIGEKYLESLYSTPWHVLVRFGKWKEIIARQMEKDPDTYPGTIATSHYARGIAYAVLGRHTEADREREHFREALRNESLKRRYLFHNIMHDPEKKNGILDIAEALLDGEVEYHKGNKKEAFEHLRLAVQRDTSLEYDEPWGWMTPARHALGALLLEAGELEEAERVYREDLKQYTGNMWSLLGLQQVLAKQNRPEEAAATRDAFKRASARTDTNIGASCLCAKRLCCQR